MSELNKARVDGLTSQTPETAAALVNGLATKLTSAEFEKLKRAVFRKGITRNSLEWGTWFLYYLKR